MFCARPIVFAGSTAPATQRPLICTPLVGRDTPALRDELAVVLPKAPDVLEWRVDFFEPISSVSHVLQALQAIKFIAPETPLLFTRRSVREGGQRIAIDEAQVLNLCEAVCASGLVQALDCELASPADDLQRMRACTRANGVQLVVSSHNFAYTPALSVLRDLFLRAEQLGADVAKVAVMPRDTADVLNLLQASHAAAQQLRIPLIAMAMGPLGAITRLVGGEFGSALTFAVGAKASAPGQVPIEALRSALELVAQIGQPVHAE